MKHSCASKPQNVSFQYLEMVLLLQFPSFRMSMREPFPCPAVKIFAPNKKGRDFAVGDIHGHFEHLITALEAVGFSPDRDRVFSVGDVIDRGPDSKNALSWLQMPWFHAVRGNHEQAAVECATGKGDIAKHKRTGGSWLYELSVDVQANIVEALVQLPFMIEIGLADGRNVGVVHAQVPITSDTGGWEEAKEIISGRLGCAHQEAAVALALLARSKLNQNDRTVVGGVDNIYVGHSTVPQAFTLGNVTYIDTGCSFDDGALSLIELNSGSVTAVDMRGVTSKYDLNICDFLQTSPASTVQ